MTRSAPAALDPALGRWRNGLMGAYVVGGITVSAWGPRLPAIADQLQIGTAEIGAVFATGTFGAVAGLAVSTPVNARLGGRFVVPVALLVVAAMVGTGAAAVGLGQVGLLVAAFVVIGFALAVMDVAINVDGAALEVARRRTVMPLLHGAWSVGVVAGAAVGAICAALDVAPAVQFAGEAVAIAGIAGGVRASLPRAAAPQDAATQSGGATPFRTSLIRWLRGWTDRRLLLIGVVILGVDLGESSANTWLTLGAQRDHGLGAPAAAGVFTCFAVGEALTRLFAGPLVDRLGRVRSIRWTTAAGAIGVILFALPVPLPVVLGGVLLWSVGVSMGFPLGMSAAGEGGGDVAARVNVVASIGYLSGVAGPVVIGLLAERTGLLNSFWLIAAMMAVAFVCAGALRPLVRST